MSEGARLMTICNACRYCEGYCAVFPAMEKRLEFQDADLRYLANLCHNCGECLDACQYAPPHEFAVNVPLVLAQIRLQSYRYYAWPGFMARAFERNGLVVSLLLCAGLAGALLAGGRVFSHAAMVRTFGVAGLFVLIVWGVGFYRFWKESGATVPDAGTSRQTLTDIFALTNLRGGKSDARRWLHHLAFYGFLLCFAATCVAAFYDNVLGWRAPYPYLSLPVVLGTVGGIGLLAGPAGLLVLKCLRDPAVTDPDQNGMDNAFIVLLLLASFTGLLLMALRNTVWIGQLLDVHLAVILVFFLTLPYGKFVHGIYRSAALLRYSVERRS
jgi:citrate/tricarballylate utilization protein